jgi:hypothetical protein
MLDIHIATLPNMSIEWFNQCIDSVEIAANNANFPINIHVFEGVVGHIGKARELGYSKGNFDYVTYVDCDDYVLPNAFSCLENAFKDNPTIIKTGEIHLQNGNKKELINGWFHLMVYKRSFLKNINFENHIVDIDVHTKKLAEANGNIIINIPLCVYVHRMYWESGSRVLSRKIIVSESTNV